MKLQFEETVKVGGGQVVYMDPDNSFGQEKYTQQMAAALGSDETRANRERLQRERLRKDRYL